jgi:hypothetical protein
LFDAIPEVERTAERRVSATGLPSIASKVTSYTIQMTSRHRAKNLSRVLNLQVKFFQICIMIRPTEYLSNIFHLLSRRFFRWMGW